MALPAFQTIGTIASVMGTLKSAGASSSAANFNAGVNDQNAAIALQQGEAGVVQQRRVNELRLGNIRAGYGASGLRSDSGSALDVLEDSVAQAELDTQNIRYNATLKSMGYSQSAELDRRRASSARTTGLFTAAGQAILGGTKAYAYKTGVGQPIPDYDYDTFDSKFSMDYGRDW